MRHLFFVLSIFACFFSLAQVPEGYYHPAQNLNGQALKSALHEIIKGHQEYPYTSTSTDVWDILKQTDKDPTDPSKVIGLYSGFKMDAAEEYANAQGWSREHVWAQSRGDFNTDDKGPGTDVHHIRAEDVSTNSARNNRNFNNCSTPYTDQAGKYNGPTPSFTSSTEYSWQPRAEMKGDVARMLFYVATRYEGQNGELDLELTEELQSESAKAPLHAKLSVLLIWHQEDPVSAEEINRNNIVFQYQGNRNPFIDHPEFADRIWGDQESPCAGLSPNISINTNLLDLGYVDIDETVVKVASYTFSSIDVLEVEIAPPPFFEISLEANYDREQVVRYGDSLKLYANQNQAIQHQIYVFFVPNLDSAAIYHGQISHVGECGTSANLQVKGELNTLCAMSFREVKTSTNNITFAETSIGGHSNSYAYQLSFKGALTEMEVVPSDYIELSFHPDFDETIYTKSNPLVYAGDQSYLDIIYVRFAPLQNAGSEYHGSISHITSLCGNEAEILVNAHIAKEDEGPVLGLLPSPIFLPFVSPNPINGQVNTISFGTSEILHLYNAQGLMIGSFQRNQGELMKTKLDALSVGTYFLIAESLTEKSVIQRLIKIN